MSIAEELYALVKDEWEGCQLSEDGKQIFHEDIESYQLLFDESQEWAGFINWALDELAKKYFGVMLEWCGEWRVRLASDGWPDEWVMNPQATKTLALAHALVEVRGDLEEKNV